MMDLDALREALGRVPKYALMLLRTDSPIVTAARAVLDSEEAWRCETHGEVVNPLRMRTPTTKPVACAEDSVAECSMVRVRLLAKEKL